LPAGSLPGLVEQRCPARALEGLRGTQAQVLRRVAAGFHQVTAGRRGLSDRFEFTTRLAIAPTGTARAFNRPGGLAILLAPS
jgi:hypothetical protein